MAASTRLATVGGDATRLDTDTPVLTAAEILGCHFPTARDVLLTRALFPSQRRWEGQEGRSLRLEIAAGVIALRVADPARRERSGSAQVGVRVGRVSGSLTAPNRELGPLRLTERPWESKLPRLHDAARGEATWLSATPDPGPIEDPTPRSQITEWTAASRRNMVRAFAEADWSTMFGQSPGLPGMTTLTYPGDWLTVAPNGKAVKAHLRAWVERFARRWGYRPAGGWKLEFQGRGAPHFHLLFNPPRCDGLHVQGPVCRRLCGHESCRRIAANCRRAVPKGDRHGLGCYREWLSKTWAEIVDHPDPVHRMRHERAGTALDFEEAGRMRDPKRIAVYFLGHSAKHKDGKEYQHVVPEAWQEPGQGPGRFWGIWGLERVRVAVELTPADFIAAKRTLRRWSKAQGVSRIRSVPRDVRSAPDYLPAETWYDPATGEVCSTRIKERRRNLTRPVVQLDQARMVGGWLCVNNGPAFATQLSRYLSVDDRRDVAGNPVTVPVMSASRPLAPRLGAHLVERDAPGWLQIWEQEERDYWTAWWDGLVEPDWTLCDPAEVGALF